MEHVNTFEFHKNNPSESVEKYIKRKRVELSHEIRASKKIYLDTNYWILLRDARIKERVDDNIVKLLHLLETLVEGGHALCPISTDTFWEIQKQSDVDTLKATIKIIDDLSKGIAIISLPERFDFELNYFVLTKLKQPVYSPDEMIWTKIPYILGFVTPVSKTLPPDMSTAIQKAFIDQMWVISLMDMYEQLSQGPIISPPDYTALSKTLNNNKCEHIDDHSSFKQLFMAEIAGILDVYRNSAASIFVHLYEMETGSKPFKEEIAKSKGDQYMVNLICRAFRLNKITTEFPSLHVMAKIHAAARWDKNRQFKPNDIYDFHHAIDAIPYYDYFLTDHSLRHLVSQEIMGFNTISHCKTISGIEDAISELSQIATTE
jgi:hypothetical protein